MNKEILNLCSCKYAALAFITSFGYIVHNQNCFLHSSTERLKAAYDQALVDTGGFIDPWLEVQ